MVIGNLKIFFMGTSNFSSKIIEGLLEKKVPIANVITQPDRPSGREKKIIFSKVKKIALENNIPIKQFQKIDEEVMNFFKTENPDLIIVASYGLILPSALIDLPKFGCINVHPSLLPDLRGPSPIQTALLNNLEQTGTSIMLMDKEIDHGPILSQKEISISSKDNYQSLEKKLAEISNEILVPTIEDFINKKIKPKEQKHHIATFTKIIDKDDGRIIWSKSSEQINGLYRAFHLWPKIFCFWEENEKKEPKKIIFQEISIEKNDKEYQEKKYGEVFRNKNEKVCIKTGKGLVLPQKIQLAGRNVMDIETFCNGRSNFVGSILL